MWLCSYGHSHSYIQDLIAWMTLCFLKKYLHASRVRRACSKCRSWICRSWQGFHARGWPSQPVARTMDTCSGIDQVSHIDFQRLDVARESWAHHRLSRCDLFRIHPWRATRLLETHVLILMERHTCWKELGRTWLASSWAGLLDCVLLHPFYIASSQARWFFGQNYWLHQRTQRN